MTVDTPAQFLPHGAAMVYVQSVLACTADSCSCVARFATDNPFARRGRVRSYITVEAAAQAIAIHEGLNEVTADGAEDNASSRSKIGYLVALSDLELHQAHVPVDCDFEIAVQRNASVPGLAVYEIHVAVDGNPVATASLKTFRAP
ncbi:MAG: hypothetical protein AAF581_21380 [Planctomycetota bacterium]